MAVKLRCVMGLSTVTKKSVVRKLIILQLGLSISSRIAERLKEE